MKIMAGFGFVSLKIASMIISIISKIGSILAGPFLVFVIGCSIYCISTANWKSLLILAVIGAAVVAFFAALGLLLGAIDIGIGNTKGRMR